MANISKTSKKGPGLASRKVFGRFKTDNQKFYNSAAWRKTSKAKLAQCPTCECDECLSLGRVLEADQVDHYNPISEGGDRFAFNNLRSINRKCHAKKSALQNKRGGGA